MPNILQFDLSIKDYISPKLVELAERFDRFTNKVEKPHKVHVDMSQASSGLQSLAGLAGRAFAAIGLFETAKGIVSMGADMEQTRVQFETFTGSAEKGNKVIADLQKFALATPFEDSQVISAGRSLLAFGEDASSLQPILTKLGNISSATGKDFNELVTIYGKNKLSGIIQGEDLNQLVEGGIPVMKSLAKQLGVNEGLVKKMGSEGKITFGMLEKAFDDLGGPAGQWGKLMEKQSQTLAGRWSSLVGFAQNMGGKLGEAINPFLGKLVDGGNAILQFVSTKTDKIMQIFQPLAEAFQPLTDAFDVVMVSLGLSADGGDMLTTVFNGLATVINYLAPVINIAAKLLSQVWIAGAKVQAVIMRFIETSPRLQKFFVGLYSGAVAAFKGIAEAVGKYLGGVGNIIEGVFTGNFGKIKSGLMQTLSAVGDTQKVGEQAAGGFMDGYKKGFKKSSLFDIAAKAPGSGTDAASAFMTKPKAPGGSLAPGLAAAKAAGAAGANGGSKVTNITLRINQLIGEVKVSAATVSEGADQIADIVIKKIMAELNDVNTLASVN